MTGKLGSRILLNLLETIPASEIAISARDPARLSQLSDNGHRVRQGSYEEPETLARSFQGAQKLLLISSSDTQGEAQAHHANAIEAARSAGITTIYYTFHQGSSPSSPFWPCRDHAATEDMLDYSGICYVSLRNGFYLGIIGLCTQSVQYTNSSYAPTDGKVSWTHHDDLAKAIALLMIRDGPLPKIIILANPQAMDFNDVAKVYSELKGIEVSRRVVGSMEYLQQSLGDGMQEGMASGLIGILQAAEQGLAQSSDPSLGDLLEGRFTTVKDYIRRYSR